MKVLYLACIISSMANLREEIFKLTNPAPVFKDPEDTSDDETKAKLVDQEDLSFSDISAPSRLRQRNAIILADTDKRYAGKKTSRKALVDNDNDFGSDEDDYNDNDDNSEQSDMLDDNIDIVVNDDDDDDDDDGSENAENDENFAKRFKKLQTQEFSFEDDGDYSKYANDDESFDEEEDNDTERDDGNEGSDDDMSDLEGESDNLEDDDDDDEGIQKFSRAATDEVAKGQAAKQQLGLWDSLLEGRIKLQKAVSIVNQLPQKDKWSEFSSQSEEFMEESNKVQEVLTHLLGSLVHLQDLMLHQNTETRNLADGNQSKKDKQKKSNDDEEDDDEEIPSDSDEEMVPETVKQTSKPSLKRKNLDIDEYPGLLKKQHTDFHSYRDATIQKWFDKTRLATGKVKGKSFSAFDQSALVQIKQILSDKDRLIKRTQLKRSTYRVLGNTPKIEEPEILPQDQDTDNAASRDHLKDYDVEIFDDDDFYHQMLRELIEKKTTNVNDPVALSRQWLEIQKLRSKTKKVVDTKASKGRKVRYDVHKKLVNFMAPVETCDWTHEARDEFFKSLFGRRFQGMNI